MIASGGRQKDSAIHIDVSILPKIPLSSRLTHNIKQSSMCLRLILKTYVKDVSTKNINISLDVIIIKILMPLLLTP